MKIRVGSRESKLAVVQSEIVIDFIKKNHPSVEIELVTMKTTGDKILDKTLDKIGGKGLFVKELDAALLENKVDVTVHSFKDMPAEIDERLPIVAVSAREDAFDALVLPNGATELDLTKPIGCASRRRQIQLEKLYPGCITEPIRGNVLTRLQKLDSGEFGATTLAMAGLRRLGLAGRATTVFTINEMIPAACQGVLAVQARAGFDLSFLDGFNDEDSWDVTQAERAFIAELNGGCSSPVAAYGEISGESLTLHGLYVDDKNKAFRHSMSADRKQGAALGRELARTLQKGDTAYEL